MPKLNLPECMVGLVEKELAEEVSLAWERAMARGVNPIMAAGAIIGTAVVATKEAGGGIRDLLQTATVVWQGLKTKVAE